MAHRACKRLHTARAAALATIDPDGARVRPLEPERTHADAESLRQRGGAAGLPEVEPRGAAGKGGLRKEQE